MAFFSPLSLWISCRRSGRRTLAAAGRDYFPLTGLVCVRKKTFKINACHLSSQRSLEKKTLSKFSFFSKNFSQLFPQHWADERRDVVFVTFFYIEPRTVTAQWTSGFKRLVSFSDYGVCIEHGGPFQIHLFYTTFTGNPCHSTILRHVFELWIGKAQHLALNMKGGGGCKTHASLPWFVKCSNYLWRVTRCYGSIIFTVARCCRIINGILNASTGKL